MTFSVGLTGGIGSGKSTVAAMWQDLGVPIIDADLIARELVQSNQPAYHSILHRYGREILLKGAEINRSKLREIIFENETERKWLQDLLHPLIYQEIVKKISEVTEPYCVVVIPLLAENYTLYKPILDFIVVLDATESQQITWATKREECNPALIKKMISLQANREDRKKIADVILENQDDLQALEKKVKDLHKTFLSRNQLV